MSVRTLFDGREYGDPDEMPPEVRQAYDRAIRLLDDRERDGVPDVLQGGEAIPLIRIEHDRRLVVNDKEYGGLEEIPSELRGFIEKLMRSVGGMPAAPAAERDRSSSLARTSPPAAVEIGSPSLRDLLLIVVGVLAGLALAVALFLLLGRAFTG